MRVAIVGGGNMGRAFALGFLVKGGMRPEDLMLIEKSEERCRELQSLIKCEITPSIPQDVREYDSGVLAVNPQDREAVCGALGEVLEERRLILSIMAGCSVANLQSELSGHKAVVRAMPNLPAQIGKGVAVYFVTAEV